MDIVTKEQIDKLDGLIEKYNHPELTEEMVAGEPVTITKWFDISSLKKRKKNLITQKQCENIVTAASVLLENISNAHDFVRFLNRNEDIFYFDSVYFVEPYVLYKNIKQEGYDKIDLIMSCTRKNPWDGRTPHYIDCDKVIATYTNLTNFCEYIKKYPLTENDVLKIISQEENN